QKLTTHQRVQQPAVALFQNHGDVSAFVPRDRSCPSHSCSASGLWRMVKASCFSVATSYRLTLCFSSAQSTIQARIGFSSSFSSNFMLLTRSAETTATFISESSKDNI